MTKITVGEDRQGRFFVMDDAGFAASFVGGIWLPRMIFNGQDLMDDFWNIKDPVEAKRLYDEAKKVLGK